MAAGPESVRAQVRRRATLDQATQEAMWCLYERYYEGVSAPVFFSDLAEKSHVILLTTLSGAVVGFSTLSTYRVRCGGQAVRVLFSGDTILDRPYWGDRSLQHAFGRFMTRYRLRHPFAPMYWFLISKGYKTYLLLSRNFPEHWPRHDLETPPHLRTLLATLAQDRFGTRWDGARGIVLSDGAGPHLRSDVAPTPDDQHAADDVRFFLARNPGHVHGEELACVGRITIGLWFRYALRKLKRNLSRQPVVKRRKVSAEDAG